MLAAVLTPILGGIVKNVAAKFFPDPKDEQKRLAMTQEFAAGMIEQSNAIELAASDIVKTEAASRHWLAANWRPILMLTFGALIVARWLGWSAPGLSEPEVLALWEIVKYGLSGYIVGRSAEKIVPTLAAALKRKS